MLPFLNIKCGDSEKSRPKVSCNDRKNRMETGAGIGNEARRLYRETCI